MSRLYIVATPIGNLEDMTVRALRILGEVRVVACEDTRRTAQLLNHYGIKKRLISCHAHNEDESKKGILKLLDEGTDVAYCSDAGTPSISDPGARLVEYVREKSGHEIIPLPGPSALTTLVSAAGDIGKSFLFEGFLSQKATKRKKRLEELVSHQDSFIIYESPFRILRTLSEMASIPRIRRVVVGRELTKSHEEILVGTPEEVLETLSKREGQKGEFVVLVTIERDSDDRA